MQFLPFLLANYCLHNARLLWVSLENLFKAQAVNYCRLWATFGDQSLETEGEGVGVTQA